ncbi:MAG: holo-ACP synthase [Clostridia bacterium]
MEIGTDIISVARIKKQIKNKNFVKKIYTQTEIDYAGDKAFSCQHYAGFFAVKESVIKCFNGKGFFAEIEVNHLPSGKPFLVFYGETKKIFDNNFKISHISISHTSTDAIAVCVLE